MDSERNSDISRATESGRWPGQFSLGSEMSRAAARSMLEARTAGHPKYIRPALETLSPEDQDTLAPYLAARDRGEACVREWPIEVHQIMGL
jgi:hypothetical protein